MRIRNFATGVAGGAVGAGLLVLALFLLGVTDVTKTETVKVTTPTVVSGSADGTATSAAMSPAQIYDNYAGGVVEIYSTFAPSNNFFNGGGGEGLGTGFVVSSDGYILTNAHVVTDETSGARATKVEVAFRKGDNEVARVPATIVGVDPSSDVALVKVDPAKAELHPLPLGDSSKIEVGEPVVAIGNPLGYEFSVSSGIVSALHRELQAPNGAVITNGIQTDAAINQGNSGGPLFNARGKVIGINEQIASQSGGNVGLGFAVPINTAKTALDELKSTGTVRHAWLGIRHQSITPELATALHLPVDHGVLIAEVLSGSPAEKAGLQGGSGTTNVNGVDYPTGGDIILAIDGHDVSTSDDLLQIIAERKPGDQITLKIQRGDQITEVKVTLADWPNNLNQ